MTLADGVHWLAPDRAATLPREGGDLFVAEGQVWLTVTGDARDHFLAEGFRHRVPPRRRAVVECVSRAQGAAVLWRKRSPLMQALAAGMLAVARLAGAGERALGALARSAHAAAQRA